MVPTHEVSTPPGFMLDSNSEDEVFTIMPATFEPGKTGPFFISIATDVEFSLRRWVNNAKLKLKSSLILFSILARLLSLHADILRVYTSLIHGAW